MIYLTVRTPCGPLLRLIAFSCFLLCTLLGPNAPAQNQAPDASPLQPRADGQPCKIAFVGDSITYGALVDPTVDSFPIVTGKFLGPAYKTGNFGAVAQTLMKNSGASYWDTQQMKDATAFAPDAVVIMLGTNDSKGGTVTDGTWAGAAQFTTDYLAMISYFQGLPSKPRVWIIPPVPAYGDSAYGIRGSVIHDQIDPLVKEIALKANVPTMDLNSPMSGRPEDFPDDVHPNKEGHMRMAHIVYSYLSGQPLILPEGGKFIGTQTVTIKPTVPGSKIYYTLDGSDPTAQSAVYGAPLDLTDTTTVKALAAGPGIPPGLAASSQLFTKVTPLPATAVANGMPGVHYSFYKADMKTLDDPSSAAPAETGNSASIYKLPHDKENGTGFLLTGYLTFPQDGIYMLNISSYDTSVLYIDDQLMLNDGGSKGLYVKVGGTVAVAAGAHKVKIIYSQATGNSGLGLRWSGPGVTLQDIPETAFSHEASK